MSRPVRVSATAIGTGAHRRSSCPLWVKSRHSALQIQCPLFPRKRTFVRAIQWRYARVSLLLQLVGAIKKASASCTQIGGFSWLELLFRVVSLERCLRKPFIDSRQRHVARSSFVTRPMIDRKLRIRRGAVRHDGAAMQDFV